MYKTLARGSLAGQHRRCSVFGDQRSRFAGRSSGDGFDLTQLGFGTPIPLDLAIVTGVQVNITLEQLPYGVSLDDLRFTNHATTGCKSLRRPRH